MADRPSDLADSAAADLTMMRKNAASREVSSAAVGNNTPTDPYDGCETVSSHQAKAVLRKNDIIEYKEDEADDWQKAEITGRAGKASTATRHWFNICTTDGQRKSVNLSAVHDWRRIECREENVNVVTIPNKRHGEATCVAAKLEELNRLKEFGVYEEVTFDNQPCISTTWVLVEKPAGVKARLVARGFEEEINEAKDSHSRKEHITDPHHFGSE